ncbi:DUF3180 domain-containing protein [Actinomyces vulturis]|uniref:DUF3180 domain-containing protein n=1 Tax=Actinomyces vulturis TaxID=1857645 RepID=UPI00082D8848|nr:DUF3180 domain-containing protein [Actinomyces vulturis]
MNRIRPLHVLLCALIPGIIIWASLTLVVRHQGWVPPLQAWGAATALVIAVCVLIAGYGVKRMREHQSTWMNPHSAALTAVAGQSSILAGAVFSGVYAGEFFVALQMASSPARTDLLISCLACLTPCIAWVVVGYVVQSWCSIDESDDEPGSGQTSGPNVSQPTV